MRLSGGGVKVALSREETMVTERQLTDRGQKTYVELATMTERDILLANNLRLRGIQRELHSIRMLLAGIIIACIGLVVALVLLNWLS
jgi:hypothetical protein